MLAQQQLILFYLAGKHEGPRTLVDSSVSLSPTSPHTRALHSLCGSMSQITCVEARQAEWGGWGGLGCGEEETGSVQSRSALVNIIKGRGGSWEQDFRGGTLLNALSRPSFVC